MGAFTSAHFDTTTQDCINFNHLASTAANAVKMPKANITKSRLIVITTIFFCKIVVIGCILLHFLV